LRLYSAVVHVTVNREICQGHARCYALCPEVFELDDLGFALAQDHTPVPEQFEGQVRRAVSNCPENAISADD
jgi:ferredoxin